DATASARTITVTNPDGATPATCTGCFTVTPSPTLAGVTPNSKPQGATGQIIELSGTGFVDVPTVSFGTGIQVNSVAYNSAIKVTVNIDLDADAAAGLRSITLTNPDGGVGTCTDCFTVDSAPTVTGADPLSGGQGASGLDVVLTGTSFLDEPAVDFGSGITVKSVAYGSLTEVTVNIDIDAAATLGARTITLTNPDGGVGTCTGCFTVTAAPSLTSASPTGYGRGATGQDVVLTGAGFVDAPTVGFSGSGVTVNDVTWDSATQVTVNIDIGAVAAVGARTITLTNPDGGVGTCDCFTVEPATEATITLPTTLNGVVTVEFDEDVSGVTTSNFVLRRAGTTANYSGSVTCADGTSAAVPCTADSVRSAVLRPTSVLVAGRLYTAQINPEGAASMITNSVDAEVPGSSASGVVSVAQEETGFGTSYTWLNRGSSSAYGGSYRTTHLANARINYAFSGSAVIWYTVLGPDQGWAKVYVDGVYKGSFNQYSSSARYRIGRRLSGLRSGSHRLTIVVTGKKGSSAGRGTWVSVDAISSSSTGRDVTPALQYGWAFVSTSIASGGRYAVSDVAGERAAFRFDGTGIDVYMVLGRNRGKARIYVDGKAVMDTDTYYSSSIVRRRSIRGLADGAHTLVVLVLGQKRSASSGTAVAIDRFVVR
ncbi:MAG: hypothetical protein WDA27_13880, partial [Actinomycetota bacterium]